jgi:predicted phage tail protein
MKVVKVYGALRKRLGQCRFEFDVNTPAQAIKALCVNFPGLDKWLIDSEKDGVGYRVAISKEKVTEENVAPMLLPFSDREVFSITPVVAGAGRGAGLVFAGIALIGLSAVSFGAGGAFAGAFGTTGIGAAAGSATAFGSIALLKVGAYLTLSGIAQAISPQPDLDSTLDEAVQLESFTFSNVLNTSRQGLPVPIAYGRVFVGSAVLSSGLDVDQQST